jgi:hypothetical protein
MRMMNKACQAIQLSEAPMSKSEGGITVVRLRPRQSAQREVDRAIFGPSAGIGMARSV